MNGSVNLSLREMPRSMLPDPEDLVIGFEEELSLFNDTETQDTKFTSTNNLRIVSLAGEKMFLKLHFMNR